MNVPSSPDSERIRSMIEAGRPLSELALLFPSKLAALHYYAEFMTRKFGRPLSAECASCGESQATHEEVYTWQAIVNTRATILWSFIATALALVVHHIVTRFY